MILARVPSLSHPHTGTFYDIQRDANGRLTCTCVRFSFGKRGASVCSHTNLYEKIERALARCVSMNHRPSKAARWLRLWIKDQGLTHLGSASLKGLEQIAELLTATVCHECLVSLVAGMTSKVKREFIPKAVAKEKIALARKRRKHVTRVTKKSNAASRI